MIPSWDLQIDDRNLVGGRIFLNDDTEAAEIIIEGIIFLTIGDLWLMLPSFLHIMEVLVYLTPGIREKVLFKSVKCLVNIE